MALISLRGGVTASAAALPEGPLGASSSGVAICRGAGAWRAQPASKPMAIKAQNEARCMESPSLVMRHCRDGNSGRLILRRLPLPNKTVGNGGLDLLGPVMGLMGLMRPT